MKISIIIPVYNVENYLDECLESVVGQSYSDLEIILVDDGSTDSSGEKCDEWGWRDNRIHVFHKENGGAMTAWKHGFLHSSGEYIGFVDSDDWIDSDMFEMLLKASMDNANADMVVSSFIHENSVPKPEAMHIESGYYTKERIESEIYPILLRRCHYSERALIPSRCSKLFKREILSQVLSYCDDQITFAEDLLTTFSAMAKVKSMVVLGSYCPYHYRETNSSVTRSFFEEKYEKAEKLEQAMLKASELYNCDMSEQIYGDFVSLYLQLIACEILFSDKGHKKLKQSIKERFKSKRFMAALNFIDKRRLTFKQKLNILLIKCNMISLLIFLRKLK